MRATEAHSDGLGLARGIIVAVLIEGAAASAVGAVLAPYGFVFVLICCGCLIGLAAILEPEFTE